MSFEKKLELRFRGVRGSRPTPGPENIGFGGNTACLEVRFGQEAPLVFDAGTGIQAVCRAHERASPDRAFEAHLFLTHFHWDHIQGIPFMRPLYRRDSRLAFYSGFPADYLRRALEGQMTPPYFPVKLASLVSESRYRQVGPDGTEFEALTVRSIPLNHPEGSMGYRIDSPRGSIVYASDHEHGDASKDAVLRRLCEGVDVLVYDAQYTPDEYPLHQGWGHGTWLEACRVACEARVKHLVLFHHDPWHDDRKMEAILSQARKEFSDTSAAREGQCILL